MDIYEVKRYQRHPLAIIMNNWSETPIAFDGCWYNSITLIIALITGIALRHRFKQNPPK